MNTKFKETAEGGLATNVAVNAVKFLYEHVWEKPREFYNLPRAKKKKSLPQVLHESEIERLFSSVKKSKT